MAFVSRHQHVRIPRGESMEHQRNANLLKAAGAGILSRRGLLQCAGWSVAAAALPSGLFAAETVSPVMAKLSAYMSEAGGRALPDEVVEKAKHHILDTFAAMISGSDLPPARAAFTYARDFTTDKTATIVASKMTSSPPEAAFINGMLAHSDETDDSNEFSQSHPGCAVVPATLAAGEKFGIDGTRFLRAVTLGYDVGPRMTISFGALNFRNDSHKSTHAISSDVRSGGRGRLRRELERAADALAARLHCPAILGHRRMESRYRAHRKSLRLRRHERAQRSHLRPGGPRRI